jgi:uncharacterized protein YukE
MSRSWADVKKLLDDPYVDADTKEHLLAAYIREEGYYYGDGLSGPTYLDEDRLPSDVKGYYDKYKLDAGDFYEGSLDDVYGDAENERDEKSYSYGLNDERVEDGRREIDGMRAPVEGSTTGVQKSDEIFEKARPALRLWEDFIPINDKVPSDQLGKYGKINLENDIKKRFDEQVGISFKNMLADAKRLRDAHKTLTTLNGDTEAELNKTYKDWTGPAANASFQYWSEKVAPNISELLSNLHTAPDLIDTAVTNIFTACKTKADEIITLYQNCRGTVGSATPEIAAKVVKLASGDFDSQDEVLEVAAWVDSVTGSNLESTMRHDSCDLNDGNKSYTIEQCKKWIRESFNVDLHDTMYETYKKACDDAFESVNEYYQTLNDALKKYENEFQGAPTASTPGQTQPPGTTNPSQSQVPGTSNPSVGTPPGSSTPPGSATPPPVTMPGSSTTPSGLPDNSAIMPPGSTTDPAGTTSPSSTLPGVNTPGSTLPGGVPGAGGTGIDPTTGLPYGSGMAPDGSPTKQVTIKDGNRTITVGQPDMRGRSKVTVDDGTGEPREYEVDFTPDEPGETYEDGVIKAGPDGTAVIQDGDAAITLEQVPGAGSQMKMTVDDGTPASYDFDFDAGTDLPSPGLTDSPSPSSLGSDPAGSFGGGGGGGGGGVGGGDFGGAGGATPGASTTPGPGTMVGAQVPDGAEKAGAGAAAAAAGAGAGGAAGQGGAPMGGMPMGGMGGMGQGGGGGDQTRQSKWRTQGSLFDDNDPAANFSGIVGRDPAEKPKTPKR